MTNDDYLDDLRTELERSRLRENRLMDYYLSCSPCRFFFDSMELELRELHARNIFLSDYITGDSTNPPPRLSQEAGKTSLWDKMRDYFFSYKR